ncbi:transglutaminase domain-containing protein [Hutsoniella sourekii]|uniref:transglutaminase domain-containing protein n=1 Tax=Hutsoniella sourekii TaxID=87650 RepID=UPI00048714F2|nr:transglutaminase-like domain-containing protein [Hutsoniella sourekii]
MDLGVFQEGIDTLQTYLTDEQTLIRKDFPEAIDAGQVAGDDLENLVSQVINNLDQGHWIHYYKLEGPIPDDSQIQTILQEKLMSSYYGAVISSYQTWTYSIADKHWLLFDFSFHHSLADEKEIHDWAYRLAQQMTGWDDYQKALHIHDTIINMASYSLSPTDTVNGFSIHSPIAILQAGEGVCQAYAGLFQIASEYAGLKSRLRTGYAHAEGQISSADSHAWNEVLIEDTWLGVDTTWDDPVILDQPEEEVLLHDYFLTDLSSSHQANDAIH